MENKVTAHAHPCVGPYNKNTWDYCVGTVTVKGNTYSGPFRLGLPNGLGVVTRPDGSETICYWQLGKCAREQTSSEESLRQQIEQAKREAAREVNTPETKALRKRLLEEAKAKKEQLDRKKQESEIKRKKRVSKNAGFRDLKPGMSISEIRNLKVCDQDLSSSNGTRCYGINNMKFFGEYYALNTLDYSSLQVKALQKITVDLGPIVGVVGAIDQITTYLQKGETNIFSQMREILGGKYKTELEFSERDRQLFNKNMKTQLYTVYEGGKVALVIKRKKTSSYREELWLYIEYRDLEPAEKFLKMVTPKRAKKSDF